MGNAGGEKEERREEIRVGREKKMKEGRKEKEG